VSDWPPERDPGQPLTPELEQRLKAAAADIRATLRPSLLYWSRRAVPELPAMSVQVAQRFIVEELGSLTTLSVLLAALHFWTGAGYALLVPKAILVLWPILSVAATLPLTIATLKALMHRSSLHPMREVAWQVLSNLGNICYLYSIAVPALALLDGITVGVLFTAAVSALLSYPALRCLRRLQEFQWAALQQLPVAKGSLK
jgi:hypothetical protein